MNPDDDAPIELIEDHAPPEVSAQTPWRILIVDDDADVHSSTEYALVGLAILDRPLVFLHCYSAAETRDLLRRECDIAVILLDVVMESEHAGLDLVRHIRQDAGLTDTRIVLRTGQPGYAPEIDAIRDYDINDYRTKSELNRSRLYVTLTSAVRAYQQIRSIERSRHGLESIMRGSNHLITLTGNREFAAGVITQITALLGIPRDGLVCARLDDADWTVIAAAGQYARRINQPLGLLDDLPACGQIRQAIAQQRSLFGAAGTSLHLPARQGHPLVAHVDAQLSLPAVDRALLEVFGSNIGVCHDNVMLLERLHRQAFYDPLLGLPNRLHLSRMIDQALQRDNSSRLVLVLADIDHFAEANNAFGHAFGDRLLGAVAQRFTTRLPAEVVVARITNDTFGLLGIYEDLLPYHLVDLFRSPLDMDGAPHLVSVSFGLVKLSDLHESADSVIKQANIALKRVKNRRCGEYCQYTPRMEEEARVRMQLLQALRRDVQAERLFIVYQPQIALADGGVVGVEALLRWCNDDGVMIPPDRFIPMAETSGLIVSLGQWVLRTACREAKTLIDRGHTQLRLAVNISMIQFDHPLFLNMLSETLKESGMPPANLELEITESIAMLDIDKVIIIIGKLRRLGVTLALDDFGTGYSSLSSLERLSVDRLKIDRSFIQQMRDDEPDIAALIIKLGKQLRLTVIAEGIETESQAERMRLLGCAEAQGYLYAKPMESGLLAAWLDKQKG